MPNRQPEIATTYVGAQPRVVLPNFDFRGLLDYDGFTLNYDNFTTNIPKLPNVPEKRLIFKPI